MENVSKNPFALSAPLDGVRSAPPAPGNLRVTGGGWLETLNTMWTAQQQAVRTQHHNNTLERALFGQSMGMEAPMFAQVATVNAKAMTGSQRTEERSEAQDRGEASMEGSDDRTSSVNVLTRPAPPPRSTTERPLNPIFYQNAYLPVEGVSYMPLNQPPVQEA